MTTVTIAQGATSGTFYLTTNSTTGNRSISITTSPVLTYSGSPITYDATGGAATGYTLSGATSGLVGGTVTVLYDDQTTQTAPIVSDGAGGATAVLPDFFTFTDARYAGSSAVTPTGTGVPVPGRIVGILLDDLALDLDPNSPNYAGKRGIPNTPIGLRDFTGKLVTTVYSDDLGRFEVLLPSTGTYNCPLPAGPCPGNPAVGTRHVTARCLVEVRATLAGPR